jgi:hypothetical protein
MDGSFENYDERMCPRQTIYFRTGAFSNCSLLHAIERELALTPK